MKKIKKSHDLTIGFIGFEGNIWLQKSCLIDVMWSDLFYTIPLKHVNLKLSNLQFNLSQFQSAQTCNMIGMYKKRQQTKSYLIDNSIKVEHQLINQVELNRWHRLVKKKQQKLSTQSNDILMNITNVNHGKNLII